MGCTVREKHIRTDRRSRSVKSTPSDIDHHRPHDVALSSSSLLAKSMLESGFKPWTCNNNNNNNNNNNININDNNKNENLTNPNLQNQNPNFEECGGWGYCTEEQLEEILLKNLRFLYGEAISKLVSLGYDDEVALKAVLRNGHCYGGMDVLTNIFHNSLAYLNSGCCGNEAGSEESELVFTDLRQLEEYSLAGMVCLLQQVRPHLSRGDAMWCLLMSDLHVGRASTIEIPMIPSPNGKGMDNVSGGIESVGGSGISVPPGLCKFHGGWGFGSGGNSEMFVNGGFGGKNQREIDCPKRFNLSPSMKSLLKRNVAAFAAGFRAKQQLDLNSQPCTTSVASADNTKGTSVAPVHLPEENNQDVISSIMNKFRELNLDDSLDSVSEDQKDEIILTLLHQVKDLENQVKERKEWAHQKALQAAKKLSNDLTELKILRMEREETQRVKKGKQTLEDTTMKRLSEMESALRKASGQVDRANAAVRQLEIENAEIRAEMEASKLSASESVTTCLEVAKREKKCLKKLVAWEKQRTKLQEEIAVERQKIADLQQLLVRIHAAQKEAEGKWKQELKEKEVATSQVEEERRLKEATEGNNKRKLESLRLRMEIEFQRHKDDLQRLKQELSRLKASAQSIHPLHDPLEILALGTPEVGAHTQSRTIARLLCELDEPEKEVGYERVCVVCAKEEVSVVFLPCAHQVMCADCGEGYGKKGKGTCPCCRVPIEQRIRVFGATS